LLRLLNNDFTGALGFKRSGYNYRCLSAPRDLGDGRILYKKKKKTVDSRGRTRVSINRKRRALAAQPRLIPERSEQHWQRSRAKRANAKKSMLARLAVIKGGVRGAAPAPRRAGAVRSAAFFNDHVS